jgi:hypothetical protein
MDYRPFHSMNSPGNRSTHEPLFKKICVATKQCSDSPCEMKIKTIAVILYTDGQQGTKVPECSDDSTAQAHLEVVTSLNVCGPHLP